MIITQVGRRGGYNPVTLARFNARYGRTGQRDNADPLWQQWRRDQVTQLVRRIYLETTAIKPTIKVSAATITYGFGPTSAAEYTASRTVYTGVGGFYGLLGLTLGGYHVVIIASAKPGGGRAA